MSRYVAADVLKQQIESPYTEYPVMIQIRKALKDFIDNAPNIDIVRCKECKKSHIDGKTTHYLWCVEWGRSTDVFGYCERGEREDE